MKKNCFFHLLSPINYFSFPGLSWHVAKVKKMRKAHTRARTTKSVCVWAYSRTYKIERERVCVCVFEHEREPERERRKQQLVSNKKPISCMLIIQVISLLKWNDMPWFAVYETQWSRKNKRNIFVPKEENQLPTGHASSEPRTSEIAGTIE